LPRATDLADLLVKSGVPFRTSHEIIGKLVREAEERGVSLRDLPQEVYSAAHPAFADGVAHVFDWERSVEARDLPGGTSRRAVMAQIEEARRRLGEETGAQRSMQP
jgi:argininosuccinate lyase